MGQASVASRVDKPGPLVAPPPRLGQYLTFNLGEEAYGLDILKVREIRGWTPVRGLPNLPDYLKGVLDLRGTLVPVVDLRVRFHQGQADYGPTTVLILVAAGLGDQTQTMGLVVDGVSDVLEVYAGQLRPAPNLGARIDTRFIQGLVSRDGEILVLLDLDRLLDPDEFELLQNL